MPHIFAVSARMNRETTASCLLRAHLEHRQRSLCLRHALGGFAGVVARCSKAEEIPRLRVQAQPRVRWTLSMGCAERLAARTQPRCVALGAQVVYISCGFSPWRWSQMGIGDEQASQPCALWILRQRVLRVEIGYRKPGGCMMTGTTNGQNGRYSITSVSVPPLRDRESDARVLREAPRDTLWRDELFLSQASILLTESLNATDICEQAVRLPLPYLADWCALHLVTEDAYRGAVPVIICAHVDSGKEPRARTLWQQAVQAAPRSIPSLIRVLRSSERPSPPTIVDVGSAPATHDLRGSPAVRLLERVGLATGLYLPLVAGTRTFGILTFGSATPGRYGPREVALAIAYTSRVAGVLDRAQRYQQAIEMLRVRNVVLAEIAHDLKAPAAHIARNADYARAQCAPLQAHECDAPALQTLSQIEVAAHSLSDMLDDLMAMTTQQTGSVAPLRKRETDLVALARQTIADYSHPAECHTLELDAGSLDHMVGYWDAGALRRILDNLLANAVLYSRPE